ncbi:hypothetical protein CBS101457_006852 [Exobasidium rhododendri]|nr:hypothetical protein CBS101457_006852 [Exobasidium rhododendri]
MQSWTQQRNGSPLSVTEGIMSMELDEEWDLLSSGSDSVSLLSNDHHNAEKQHQHLPSATSSTSSPLLQQQMSSTSKSYDANVLDEWRHVTCSTTPSTQSESGVSELSAVSSNGYDHAFFPLERNSTPALGNRPKREPTLRHGVNCQLCSEEIRGIRWMCHECPCWNVCEECFEITAESEVHPVHTFIRVSSSFDVFKLQSKASFNAKGGKIDIRSSNGIIDDTPVIHMDVKCHSCGGTIIGARYDCASILCRFSLVSFCQDCEALPINCHPATHPLIKYKMPRHLCTGVAETISTMNDAAEGAKTPTGAASPKRDAFVGETGTGWWDNLRHLETVRKEEARKAVDGLVKVVDDLPMERSGAEDGVQDVDEEGNDAEDEDALLERRYLYTQSRPWNISNNENEKWGHFPTAGLKQHTGYNEDAEPHPAQRPRAKFSHTGLLSQAAGAWDGSDEARRDLSLEGIVGKPCIAREQVLRIVIQ